MRPLETGSSGKHHLYHPCTRLNGWDHYRISGRLQDFWTMQKLGPVQFPDWVVSYFEDTYGSPHVGSDVGIADAGRSDSGD